MPDLPYIISLWDNPVFPAGLEPDETGLIAVGGDLSEKILLEAYSKGIFPWFVGPPVMWYSPDPRLVLFPQDFHVSKRLGRTLRQDRYTVQFDTDFEAVIRHCAAVPRKGQNGTWIDRNFIKAYSCLHKKNIAHCAAVYRDNVLRGGLYGLSLGRLFFGESMFSLDPGASKIAFYHLAQWVHKRNFRFIDCQVRSEHLVGLGAVDIPRRRFTALLAEGLKHADHRYRWRTP